MQPILPSSICKAVITGQVINCVIFSISPRIAHSWKGDLSSPQLQSLREKIVHLTLPGSNWFQLLDDGQSKLYLFGGVWVQELIEFWYQSLSLFSTWLCMQSIVMSACVVYLPYSRRHACQASPLYGTAPLCDSRLSLFCRFDQPESIFFAFAASHHRLARLCDTEPNSEPVSPSEANTLWNDPKFGCVVIMSGMTTIWVHMAVLVWSTICYQRKQAVVLVWILLVPQNSPYVPEFHHSAQIKARSVVWS